MVRFGASGWNCFSYERGEERKGVQGSAAEIDMQAESKCNTTCQAASVNSQLELFGYRRILSKQCCATVSLVGFHPNMAITLTARKRTT